MAMKEDRKAPTASAEDSPLTLLNNIIEMRDTNMCLEFTAEQRYDRRRRPAWSRRRVPFATHGKTIACYALHVMNGKLDHGTT
ncbi:hypothetical protein EJB05_34462 [Eragrostis curvula]|uniref:Uncharacterized protein n=1 Tax=Eragrostis curvula TaxID=38414 RepID=A0A5J9U5F4_9POAL|nr:hypothetical protein EJB05_34462 [Eragrostis curvula]